MSPYLRLRWLEWRWWAQLRRAKATGACAVSFAMPDHAEIQDGNGRTVHDVAADLGLSVRAGNQRIELVGPL